MTRRADASDRPDLTLTLRRRDVDSMRVNDIAEFSGSIDSGATEVLEVATEERNATMVLVSIEEASEAAVFHGLEWEYKPTDDAGWRFYKSVAAGDARTYVEPALPRDMRLSVTNVTDAAEDFDIRLTSLGPQGNNAAGSMGMPPLEDGLVALGGGSQ